MPKRGGVTVKACTFTYGPAAGSKTVVLTGDSHAAHWFPALDHGRRDIAAGGSSP